MYILAYNLFIYECKGKCECRDTKKEKERKRKDYISCAWLREKEWEKEQENIIEGRKRKRGSKCEKKRERKHKENEGCVKEREVVANYYGEKHFRCWYVPPMRMKRVYNKVNKCFQTLRFL